MALTLAGGAAAAHGSDLQVLAQGAADDLALGDVVSPGSFGHRCPQLGIQANREGASGGRTDGRPSPASALE